MAFSHPSLSASGHQRRQGLAWAAAAIAGLALPIGSAQAQAYPGRPVRLVVPFPPGGPVDTVGRTLALKLTEQWGQTAIVDNKAGAGGIVGAEIAAKAPNDGYHLFVCSIHHSVIPSLKPKLNYDIERDFVPVSFGARFPVILVVNNALPVRSVAELIALDKAKPGTLSYGSAGNGGGTHLAAELFNMQAGTKLLHVPYKGSAPAMTDLLGGQTSVMFDNMPSAIQHVRSGKLRPIAVTTAKRSPELPDVPTIAEAGVPGYEATSWFGMFAPAGTPKPVLDKLHAALIKVLNQADVKKKIAEQGGDVVAETPAQFAAFIQAESVKWGKVVKESGATAD